MITSKLSLTGKKRIRKYFGQITEAIEINDTDEEKRMNSRGEWHQPRVPRINIEI